MQRRIKVLHIITRLIVGGAQENTMLSIIGLNKLGYKAELLSGPTTGPEGEIVSEVRDSGIKLNIIPSLIRNINPIKDLKAFFDIYRFIRSGDFDIVHTHSSKAGILGRLAAALAGVPVIVHTIHGLPYHPFQSRLVNLIYILAEKLAGYVSDKILAVSGNNARNAISKGIAPGFKFEVVRSGMKLDRFQSAQKFRDKIRTDYGIESGNRVLGVIARLFHLKGHKYLIRIAPRLLSRYPDLKFMFVGDGILRDEFEKRVQDLGISDHFIFTGLIPRDGVPEYISSMDIIVHPSLREGLARVIPQGFILKKPIVIFDIDGASELVKTGETGMLVPPRDCDALFRAISFILNNPDRASAMAEKGHEIALAQFSDKKMVDDIDRIYRKTLKYKREY